LNPNITIALYTNKSSIWPSWWEIGKTIGYLLCRNWAFYSNYSTSVCNVSNNHIQGIELARAWLWACSILGNVYTVWDFWDVKPTHRLTRLMVSNYNIDFLHFTFAQGFSLNLNFIHWMNVCKEWLNAAARFCESALASCEADARQTKHFIFACRKMMNRCIIASFSKHFYAVIVLSIKMYFIRFCKTV